MPGQIPRPEGAGGSGLEVRATQLRALVRHADAGAQEAEAARAGRSADDRALFEQAWAMSAAHREELVTRTQPAMAALPIQIAPPPAAPPSVLDMLMRGSA